MKYVMDKIEFIKDICSLVEYETSYSTKGFLRRIKVVRLKIWHTEIKIHLIEIIDDKDKHIDIHSDQNPFRFEFKVGDNISDVFNWAEENGHEITHIVIKGRGRHKKNN